jgi:cell wall-associated NlpC family hydrolase
MENAVPTVDIMTMGTGPTWCGRLAALGVALVLPVLGLVSAAPASAVPAVPAARTVALDANTAVPLIPALNTPLVGFTAVNPTRVLDTRGGTGAPTAPLGAGSSLVLAVPNLPAGTTAVVLNVTATNLAGAAGSYLAACPAAQSVPACAATSVLNPTAGVTATNEVTVPVAADGRIQLYNQAGSVDVVGDLVGYHGTGFAALDPTRVLDTRTGVGTGVVALVAPLTAATAMTLAVPNLPTGTTAVVLNVTATNLTGAGGSYISVCPAAQQPSSCQQTSVLNPTGPAATANELTVPVAADGKIQLYNRAGSIDLIADVAGYLSGGFTATNPTRVLDTRNGTGVPATPVTTGSPATLTVPTLPAGTTAVVLNVTATNLTGTGGAYISVCPAAQSSSSCTTTSMLNPIPGVTTTNELTIPVTTDGKIRLFTSAGSVDLIGDLAGYLSTSGVGAAALQAALSRVGSPYVYGANGPSAFDCSGLVQWSYAQAGVILPRTTGGQSGVGTSVSQADLRPGDIVIFYDGGHDGIYAGNGMVVHAPTAGDVVRVAPMQYMPFAGARRP